MILKKNDKQMEVINTIKELRQNSKINQILLGEFLGLKSSASIGNIESPKFKHKYTLKQLYLLSEKFKYPIEDLFLSDEEKKLPKSQVINLLIKKIAEYYE